MIITIIIYSNSTEIYTTHLASAALLKEVGAWMDLLDHSTDDAQLLVYPWLLLREVQLGLPSVSASVDLEKEMDNVNK